MGLLIGIGILVGVFMGFYSAAQKKGLTPWVWGVLSIVSWFGSQFIFGIFWGIFNPRSGFDDITTILIFGLGVSIVSLIILYQIMLSQSKKVGETKKMGSDEIMDDTDIDDL